MLRMASFCMAGTDILQPVFGLLAGIDGPFYCCRVVFGRSYSELALANEALD